MNRQTAGAETEAETEAELKSLRQGSVPDTPSENNRWRRQGTAVAPVATGILIPAAAPQPQSHD